MVTRADFVPPGGTAKVFIEELDALDGGEVVAGFPCRGELHHMKTDFSRAQAIPVGDVNVNALNFGTGFCLGALDLELEAGNAEAGESSLHFRGGFSLITKETEGVRGADAVTEAAFLCPKPKHGITQNRGEIRDIGGGGDPAKSGLGP